MSVDTAKNDTACDAKAFVEHWKRVGPLLEQVRNDELRAFSHEKNARNVDRLLAEGLIRRPDELERPLTGLVQMYEILHRALP